MMREAAILPSQEDSTMPPLVALTLMASRERRVRASTLYSNFVSNWSPTVSGRVRNGVVGSGDGIRRPFQFVML